MITIVDSGIANTGSLTSALTSLGLPSRLSSEPKEIEDSEIIILPGVGAFADAMASLNEQDISDALRVAVARGSWLLGICLGMQLLMESGSEYGQHAGLGLLPGTVERLADPMPPWRIPNIGWRPVDWIPGSPFAPLWTAVPTYYFVHSYVVHPMRAEHVIGRMQFGSSVVPVAVQSGRVLGVQFHPEKSQASGLFLLKQFAMLAGTQEAQT